MRKWHYVAIVAVIIASVGGYWYYAQNAVEPGPAPFTKDSVSRLTKQLPNNAGNAEESDTIEPLIVDHGAIHVSLPQSYSAAPMERAMWNPATQQPPRPDGERGAAPRMPYADEVLIPGAAFDPISWILESKLPDLNLFGGVEESEPRDAPSPIWHPHAYQHCPYTGGCPAPSRFPLMPRD